MFRLAVFTDEVSQDFQRAVDVAVEYDLDGLEVRSVWDQNPQDISKENIARMKAILADTRLKVCSIASPFFKCELDSDQECKEHLDILRRCIALGKEFDCNIIRGFTFWRRGKAEDRWHEILDKFAEPIRILEENDAVIGIENETSTYIGTGTVLRRFLDDLNSPRVKATWDLANAFHDVAFEEVPYPEGYEQIKPHIVHVHVKDARVNEQGKTEQTPVGEGDIDFPGQFRALRDDGYEGYASLETHWRPVRPKEVDYERPGGSAFSEAGEEASRRCLDNIKKILAEL